MQDAKLLFDWENRRDIVAVSSHGGGLSMADIRKYISDIKDVYLDRQMRWVIEMNKESLGTIDLFEIDFDRARAYTGILIAEESQRRTGKGRKAQELVNEYCRDVLALRYLCARIQNDNAISRSFYTDLGFIEQDDTADQLILELEL